MRQRNKPWVDAFLKENEGLVLNNASKYKGNWHTDVFQNTLPIHVEIGTGKGQFLVNMANRHPGVNFIGIELAKSVIVTAAQKVLTAEQSNIHLIQVDAQDIESVFSDGEVAAIYLNFSDPWPKNRHEKRRLTHHTFLDKYRKILQTDGKIMMKTDNPVLFEYSLVSFSMAGMILEEIDLDLHLTPSSEHIMTEYEERFTKEGKPIYRCAVHLSQFGGQ